jgi:light-independent protochlorophyllide reductase subunit B
MMGLEEHLLQMFRGDFEFHDEAAPSHLGVPRDAKLPAAADTVPAGAPAPESRAAAVAAAPVQESAPREATDANIPWSADAEKELRKIPFFVRGKARRNTERFAHERGVSTITLETLYDAKAHFGR